MDIGFGMWEVVFMMAVVGALFSAKHFPRDR